MTMIDTAMGALRATAAKALGLNGKLTETCSREDSLLTNPPGAVVTVTPDAGRRTPDAGRRTPDAARRTPDAGRRTPDA